MLSESLCVRQRDSPHCSRTGHARARDTRDTRTLHDTRLSSTALPLPCVPTVSHLIPRAHRRANKHAHSLEESIGCRKGVNDMLTVDRSKCTQVELPLVSCRSLLRRHGLPYVLKLDIEGHEQACLRPLPELAAAAGGRLLQRLALPQYISMETGWVERHDKPPLFPWLLSLGYLRAKIVDQQAFGDWSGPYGDGALDIQTGAAWHALAGWQPAPCPHSWCDYWFALGPLARAPTRHRPLNASKVAGEAHLLDKLLLQGHLHGKWK